MSYRSPLSPVLPVLVLAASAASQDAASFRADYDSLRGHMERGNWTKAKQGIDALLKDHAGEPYAQAEQKKLVEDYSQIEFYRRHALPQPKDLVSGKVNYNKRTGKISLTYTPKTLGDFEKAANGMRFHPAAFAGKYTIKAEGKKYDSQNPFSLMFDVEGDKAYYYAAGFSPSNKYQSYGGTYIPAQVIRFEGKNKRTLGTKDSNLFAAKPWKVELDVGAGTVRAKNNGKVMLSLKKKKGDVGKYGSFAVTDNFDKLVVVGKVHPGWIQALVDDAVAKMRADFDRKFNAKDELPKWLFDGAATSTTNADAPERDRRVYPGTPSPRELFKLNNGMQLLNAGELEEAVKYLGSEKGLPADAKALLMAWVEYSRGQTELALKLCEQAGSEEPDFFGVLHLKAKILADMRRAQDADAAIRKAIDQAPGNPELYADAVVQLLITDRSQEARAILDLTRQRGVQGKEVQQIADTLAMSERGPSWARRHRHESRHYIVESDIDRKTCTDAANVLEQAYRTYQGAFGWLKRDPDEEKFRVFLFKGEAGYKAYSAKILGSAPSHTAGLYSPVLKQLLIWNLPNRDQMLQTVRHEGFHQYLDRIMFLPPSWLNEGLAEYYEAAQRNGRGHFDGGQLRKTHLARLLNRDACLSFKDMVFGARSDFYANAEFRYPQAWATVHFLRKGGKDQEKLFEALFEQLRGTGSNRKILESVFEGVDWAAMDSKFWEYVSEMRSKAR